MLIQIMEKNIHLKVIILELLQIRLKKDKLFTKSINYNFINNQLLWFLSK
jgi:hypothetical protein